MGGCQELKPTFEQRRDSRGDTGSHLCPRCRGRQHQETFSPAPGRRALPALQPQGTDSPALSHLEDSVEQQILVGSEAHQHQGTDLQVLSHQEGSVEQPILGTVSQVLHLVGSEGHQTQGTGLLAQDHSSPSQLQQSQNSIQMGTPSQAPKVLLANPLLQCRMSVLSHPRAPSFHNQHLQYLRPLSAPSLLLKTGRRGRPLPTSSTLDHPSDKEDPETHHRSSRGSPSGHSLVSQLPASDSPSPHPHPDPSLPHRNQRSPPQPTRRQTNSAS